MWETARLSAYSSTLGDVPTYVPLVSQWTCGIGARITVELPMNQFENFVLNTLAFVCKFVELREASRNNLRPKCAMDNIVMFLIHLVDIFDIIKNPLPNAAIAHQIHLCGPGFYSKAQHLHIFTLFLNLMRKGRK